ncbi:MAG: hypothetical protein AB7K86_08365 [Rhodospirillales bacterium]
MTQPEDMPDMRERIQAQVDELNRQRRASSLWQRWRAPGRDRWVAGFVAVAIAFAVVALIRHMIR